MVYILSANVCQLVCFSGQCIIADHNFSHNFLVEWFCFCGFIYVSARINGNKSNFFVSVRKSPIALSNINNFWPKNLQSKIIHPLLLTQVLNKKGDQWPMTSNLACERIRKRYFLKKFTLVSICCLFLFVIRHVYSMSYCGDLPGLGWLGWWIRKRYLL